jgi:DNA-binding MarR family transcriptional regulator
MSHRDIIQVMADDRARHELKAGSGEMIRRLASFRYQLRQFLRFSEKAAREAGITPQQHQLLLGVAGYTGRRWATISELAEFLQERHNAVVGLVDRALQRGLVLKKEFAPDHRVVRVELTPEGRQILARLAQLHRKELGRFQAQTGFGSAVDGNRVRAEHGAP